MRHASKLYAFRCKFMLTINILSESWYIDQIQFTIDGIRSYSVRNLSVIAFNSIFFLLLVLAACASLSESCTINLVMVCKKIGPKQNPHKQEVKITMIINDQLMQVKAGKGKLKREIKKNRINQKLWGINAETWRTGKDGEQAKGHRRRRGHKIKQTN